MREMVTSQALAAASGHKRKQLLVMDEVDGMSGGPGQQEQWWWPAQPAPGFTHGMCFIILPACSTSAWCSLFDVYSMRTLPDRRAYCQQRCACLPSVSLRVLWLLLLLVLQLVTVVVLLT